MRRAVRVTEQQIQRLTLGLTGATFLACAALAGREAALHMAMMGNLCGGAAAPHCGWCFAAAALALTGLAAVVGGAVPQRAVERLTA